MAKMPKLLLISIIFTIVILIAVISVMGYANIDFGVMIMCTKGGENFTNE